MGGGSPNEAGGGGGGGGAAAIGGVGARVSPQFPQNAALGASVAPQLGQRLTFVIVTGANETSCGVNAMPQSLQKVDPSRFSVPQREQVAMGSLSLDLTIP